MEFGVWLDVYIFFKKEKKRPQIKFLGLSSPMQPLSMCFLSDLCLLAYMLADNGLDVSVYSDWTTSLLIVLEAGKPEMKTNVWRGPGARGWGLFAGSSSRGKKESKLPCGNLMLGFLSKVLKMSPWWLGFPVNSQWTQMSSHSNTCRNM